MLCSHSDYTFACPASSMIAEYRDVYHETTMYCCCCCCISNPSSPSKHPPCPVYRANHVDQHVRRTAIWAPVSKFRILGIISVHFRLHIWYAPIPPVSPTWSLSCAGRPYRALPCHPRFSSPLVDVNPSPPERDLYITTFLTFLTQVNT